MDSDKEILTIDSDKGAKLFRKLMLDKENKTVPDSKDINDDEKILRRIKIMQDRKDARKLNKKHKK